MEADTQIPYITEEPESDQYQDIETESGNNNSKEQTTDLRDMKDDEDIRIDTPDGEVLSENSAQVPMDSPSQLQTEGLEDSPDSGIIRRFLPGQLCSGLTKRRKTWILAIVITVVCALALLLGLVIWSSSKVWGEDPHPLDPAESKWTQEESTIGFSAEAASTWADAISTVTDGNTGGLYDIYKE